MLPCMVCKYSLDINYSSLPRTADDWSVRSQRRACIFGNQWNSHFKDISLPWNTQGQPFWWVMHANEALIEPENWGGIPGNQEWKVEDRSLPKAIGTVSNLAQIKLSERQIGWPGASRCLVFTPELHQATSPSLGWVPEIRQRLGRGPGTFEASQTILTLSLHKARTQ